MSGELLCPFCGEATDGLTLYSVAGMFRLMVCGPCYGLLVAKERQPHSEPMKRLHRLLGLNGKEVVDDEGPGQCHTALGHAVSAVAQGQAQPHAVVVAASAVGLVSDRTPVTRRNGR